MNVLVLAQRRRKHSNVGAGQVAHGVPIAHTGADAVCRLVVKYRDRTGNLLAHMTG